MRVDTGGGSAFASEIIREQVSALQAAGKPVVVSMSGAAASGGYWISAGADEVWATPTTLTGSIGIIAAFPTIDRSLARLGVYTDGVATTELGGGIRIDRPLDERSRDVIQSSLEHGYERFIGLVASGRSIPVEEVDDIAQGKVWTGEKALELGLVDHLGGLDQALAAVGNLAGLGDSPETRWMMDSNWLQTSLLDRLVVRLADHIEMRMPGLVQLIANVNLPDFASWDDPSNLYFRCGACEMAGKAF